MPWIVSIIFLLVYEAFAILEGKRTLSRIVFDANNAWPFLSTLVGLFSGGLLVHFFWHWCPAGAVSVG